MSVSIAPKDIAQARLAETPHTQVHCYPLGQDLQVVSGDIDHGACPFVSDFSDSAIERYSAYLTLPFCFARYRRFCAVNLHVSEQYRA